MFIVRAAIVLLSLVALSAVATAIANLDQPIAALIAMIVAGLHVLGAWVVAKRWRTTAFTPTIGCLAYGFLVILALYDVPGGIYVIRESDADPLPPLLLGPVLFAAPIAALVSMFFSPTLHPRLPRRDV